MATSKIKVRALKKGSLDMDFVVVDNGNREMKRFTFAVSPLGTIKKLSTGATAILKKLA